MNKIKNDKIKKEVPQTFGNDKTQQNRDQPE